MQNWFEISSLALRAAIFTQVFAMGLATTWDDATYLFHRPALLWRSILARNILIPLMAIWLIKTLSLQPAIVIAIGILSITPVPPLLPKANLKAGESTRYAIGLLVSQAVLAIVLVPVTIRVMDWALRARAEFGMAQVTILMLLTILLPLTLGMVTAWLRPRVRRLVPKLLTVGSLMLVAGAIPLLALAWRSFGQLAVDRAVTALAIFSLGGMVLGHLLGGPSESDRTTLAVATASRHPAVAMAISAANYPNQHPLVAGTVIVYLILRIVLFLPYVHWRHRSSPHMENN